MPEAKIIVLSKPLKFGDKTYTQIEIDEPTLEAIEAFQDAKAEGANDVKASRSMLAAMTGIPVEAFLKMGVGDFNKAQDALSVFSEAQNAALGSKPTGKASAQK